jgi:type VI secretion system protein ImpM
LKPSLLIYQGLPPPTDFSGFLTGDWLRFGESQAIAVSPFFFHLEDTPDQSAAPDNDRHAAVRVQWQSFGLSHVGMVRTLNEDAFLTIPEAGIWAVADGMGGHLAGDEASRAVVDGLSAVGAGSTLEALIAEVTDSLQATNKELRQRTQGFANGQIMGSTVVVMLAVDNQCATIWAGDSRLYRYRRGCLSQLTRDHSPEGELENPNQQAPSNQNSSNVITRALGAEQELRLDMLTFEAGPGDTYLLCSDGLVKALTVDEIETILTQPDPEKCSRSLIDLALEKKARDNVTVVVVNSDHTGVNPLGRK